MHIVFKKQELVRTCAVRDRGKAQHLDGEFWCPDGSGPPAWAPVYPEWPS